MTVNQLQVGVVFSKALLLLTSSLGNGLTKQQPGGHTDKTATELAENKMSSVPGTSVKRPV